MNQSTKRLLLIDTDDLRRKSRVELLSRSGYSVDVRNDHLSAERLNDEKDYDVVILALHGNPEKAIAYSDQLSRDTPALPILLLTDYGVYVPPGTLNRSIEAGDPAALMKALASMLAGSTHVRELPISVDGRSLRSMQR